MDIDVEDDNLEHDDEKDDNVNVAEDEVEVEDNEKQEEEDDDFEKEDDDDGDEDENFEEGDERMIILMLRKMRNFEDDEVQGEEEHSNIYIYYLYGFPELKNM